MSGGRRIDDHSFWAGGRSKGSVFPEGAKVKHQKDDGHAGHLMDYEDTAEKIEAQQEKNVSQQKGHDRKPGMRY